MSVANLTRRVTALAVASGLVLLGGWMRNVVAPEVEQTRTTTQADQEKIEHTASASLLGELRGGFADWLWIKAERMVHAGVETRAMTPAEIRRKEHWQSQEAHGQETAVARHEEGETTVVPNATADHRGVLGDLERQIKPYMDMRNHRHHDPGETAALFRLMTWANPRFIPGWVVGANVLAEHLKKPREAVRFLREGAEKNPRSLEIQSEIGRYQLYVFHDAPGAERSFRRAIALGAEQRALPEDETDAWENAHRWLVIQYGRQGRRQEARAVARLAMKRFRNPGYFLHALRRYAGPDERAS